MARTCKWGVLRVVGGDLWDHTGDALITPANNRLSGREGLDSLIHKKAGQELTQITRNICLEKRKINAPPCAVTHNVVTEPYALRDNFKHIIHVVGPDCRRPSQDESRRQLLPDTYHNLFERVKAMDDVRRALRQKKHLVSRWAQRDDIAEWDSRLTAIEEEAENLRWTSAASLLDKLTTDLDSVSKESEEASELIEYLNQQWAILRNQCDASNISVGDDDRKEVEKAIAIAKDSLKVGNTEACLESLGRADKFMERLQRRV